MWNLCNKAFRHLTLYSQDLICNSPYYLPYNSYHVNLENLGLGQLKSPNCYFSLFSSLVCLILHWHCKEKFSFGHSWELKGYWRIYHFGYSLEKDIQLIALCFILNILFIVFKILFWSKNLCKSFIKSLGKVDTFPLYDNKHSKVGLFSP